MVERPLRLWRSVALALAVAAATLAPAWAKEAPDASADPALEARVMAVAHELRCLVCQNETIAVSNAGLAVDLRQQIREMLAKGMDESQIRDYMTQRYGDFVLYRPPFNAVTALLWLGPFLLMAIAVGSLIALLRRRQRMPAAAFDPEDPDQASTDEAKR